jgi:hypothetical protein
MNKIKWEQELRKLPDDYNWQSAMEAAQHLTSHYAVVFVAPDDKDRMKLFGSGTLVTIGGVKGILTADHVTELGIYRRQLKEFYICYKASGGYRPFKPVTVDQFVPIVVGKYGEAHELEGPDLTFLTIIDDKLAEALAGIKSFHPLDEQVDLSGYPVTKMPWTISGSPADEETKFVRYEPAGDGNELLRFTDYHVPAYLDSLDKRDGFDYLTLRVNAGTEGPKKYGGVSGGGIWLVSVVGRENNSEPVPVPILQGVCYYGTVPENGKATLIGHGPDSIYKRLKEKILNG